MAYVLFIVCILLILWRIRKKESKKQSKQDTVIHTFFYRDHKPWFDKLLNVYDEMAKHDIEHGFISNRLHLLSMNIIAQKVPNIMDLNYKYNVEFPKPNAVEITLTKV